MNALTAILMAAPSLAGEIESHVILSEITRPVSRRVFLLGRWLGLSTIVAAFVAVMSSAEMAVVTSVSGIALAHPAQAVGFLVFEALILVTLSILLSTRLAPVTAGIVAMVFYFLAWMSGILSALGSALGKPDLVHAATAFSLLIPSDQLWRGAVVRLEPTALLRLVLSVDPHISANPFLVTSGPTPAFIAWAAVWLLAVLAFAGASFVRREL